MKGWNWKVEMGDTVKMKRDSKRLSSKSERKKAKEFRQMRQGKSQRFMEVAV